MKLRRYKSQDCRELIKLFQDTVRTINASDYTKLQLEVWATGNEDIVSWDRSFKESCTIIAEEAGMIVGFGDMNSDGYLDRLYVHKDHQRKGIADDIVKALEKEVAANDITAFTTFSSITARPFFEKMGYKVVYKNKVVRGIVELDNFFMKKEL